MQGPSPHLNMLQFSAPAPTPVLDVLRRKPLDNAVVLKFLQNLPEGVTGYHLAEDAETATMLVIDNRLNDFDRVAYPTARSTVLISSENPALTQRLIQALPTDETLVFKLATEADRAVVARSFPLERQRALLSYSTSRQVTRDDRIAINQNSEQAPFDLFAAQGHSQSWLTPLIDSGRAFTCAFEEKGKALSACFAFQIDTNLWEIGGVYTLPQARRRKLAQSVVSAAIAELIHSNCLPRYQAEDTNTASLHLAESLGMTRCLTLTHYLSPA